MAALEQHLPTDVETIPADPRVEVVLALGTALHHFGAPAHRLEAALDLVSARLGLEGRFFSTPTSIFAGFGPISAQRTCLVRVQPGALNLEKLALVHDVTVGLVEERLSVASAQMRLRRILDFQSRYGALVTTAGYGLASAASSVFFGARPLEMALCGVIGMVVGLISGARGPGLTNIRDPLAALAASAITTVFASMVPGVHASALLIPGIIALLPGLTVTLAMTELATRHLVSGTARLVGALGQLLALGFGVALGARLERLLPPSETAWAPVDLALPVLLAVVVMGCVAFTVVMRAAPRDGPWIVVAGAVAYAGARAGAAWVGPELGAFTGAMLAAMASNIFARVIDRPALVTLVPAMLLLVPGSVGFRSVSAVLDRNVVPAMDAAFAMAAIAVALVSGILVANAALPARRPL